MIKKPFGFDKPKDSPGFLLWQVTMVWQRQIKKVLEPYAITHPQFVIMATVMWFTLHDHEITQVLIASWSKLDKMTVSKSLKDLVARGLMNRIEHETDTRAKNVTLTAQGKKMMRTLVPIVEGIDADFFGAVRSQDQQQLIAILSKLTESTEPT